MIVAKWNMLTHTKIHTQDYSIGKMECEKKLNENIQLWWICVCVFIIRYWNFSFPACDYLHCWCVFFSFGIEKKTFPFKIFKSSLSLNKYVTNSIGVFSFKRKKKIQMNLCKNKRRRARKKCYASLIYRTSFKYFVSLSLHSNHSQNAICVFFHRCRCLT